MRGEPFGGHRVIGPIGTVARAAAGSVALVIGFADMTWWDAGAALVAFPLLGLAARRLTSAGHPLSNAADYVLSLVVLAIVVALTFVTPADAPGVWAWLGVSLLLGAARGDGGCEVFAVSNACTGCRQRSGCIVFAPVDAAEARLRARPPLSGTLGGRR